MEFIGSTVFDLAQPTPPDPSARETEKYSALDEELQDRKYQRSAREISFFLQKSLPQLISAADEHDVQHVVICHADLPVHLRDKLRATANRVPILLYLEHDNLIDPIDLSKEIVGFRAPLAPVFARYRVAPNEVVSLHFFDAISKYSGPEYRGMRLKLIGGLSGYCISPETILLQQGPFDNHSAGAVDLFATAESRPELFVPAILERSDTQSSPTIVDASTHAHISVFASRTKALWRDPTDEEFAVSRIGEDSQEAILRDFPTLADTFHFIDNWPIVIPTENVGDHTPVEFPFPLQSFTLQFTVTTGGSTKKNDLIVSYQLTDEEGLDISPKKDLKGIGRISDPEVGHCFIPDISTGDSQVVKHIRPPDGVRCKGITFIRKQCEEQKIEIRDGQIIFDLKR